MKLALFSAVVWGQLPMRYLVFFQPKPDSLLHQPQAFLSPAALQRRFLQGIPIDRHDLPIPTAWLDTLGRYGRVLGASRWLNAALLEVPRDWPLPSAPFIRCLEPFTTQTQPPAESKGAPASSLHAISLAPGNPTNTQLDLLALPSLHSRGLKGQGIRVAILDAGFPGFDQVPALNHVLPRLIAKYDFVSGDSSVFDDNSHGTLVASIIIGLEEAQGYIGGAPDIEVILARTEDAQSESRQEEWNWARAVEWADSLGAYIIQSSLGYSTFDNPAENYTYADMNGHTAITSQAARLAAKKGLLVVTSAGNEGISEWHYVTAPADADSVLAAGAVDANGQIAPFSSRGPTADGRIKPDVCAMGWGTRVILPNGQVGSASGTSFAAPLITSLAACLWQAAPTTHAQVLRQAILQSADHYTNPDSAYGYGIPNGVQALRQLTILTFSTGTSPQLFPNPASETITFFLPDSTLSLYTLSIFNTRGQQLLQMPYTGHTQITLSTTSWPSGLYWLEVHSTQSKTQHIVIPFVRL